MASAWCDAACIASGPRGVTAAADAGSPSWTHCPAYSLGTSCRRITRWIRNDHQLRALLDAEFPAGYPNARPLARHCSEPQEELATAPEL